MACTCGCRMRLLHAACTCVCFKWHAHEAVAGGMHMRLLQVVCACGCCRRHAHAAVEGGMCMRPLQPGRRWKRAHAWVTPLSSRAKFWDRMLPATKCDRAAHRQTHASTTAVLYTLPFLLTALTSAPACPPPRHHNHHRR
eukprot:355668-Chlamydomonas_euryale.AAC.14